MYRPCNWKKQPCVYCRFIFQEKYFQLLEFVVFQLKFVPCKELITLSILLKAHHSLSCSIICINTLLTILKWVRSLSFETDEAQIELYMCDIEKSSVFYILHEVKIKSITETSGCYLLFFTLTNFVHLQSNSYKVQFKIYHACLFLFFP